MSKKTYAHLANMTAAQKKFKGWAVGWLMIAVVLGFLLVGWVGIGAFPEPVTVIVCACLAFPGLLLLVLSGIFWGISVYFGVKANAAEKTSAANLVNSEILD